MKKIWYGIVILVCITQQTVHTNPLTKPDTIEQLVETFKTFSDSHLQPFVTKLHSHHISVSDFVQLAAQKRVAAALKHFQDSFALKDAYMSSIESAIHCRQQSTDTILYKYPVRLKAQIPQLERFIQNQSYKWPSGLTIYYGKTDEAGSAADAHSDGSFSSILYLPDSFFNLAYAEQTTVLGHEHAHLVRHHNERLLILENLMKKGVLGEVQPELLHKLCRAQEYEADWLSLLNNDPSLVQQGIQGLKNAAEYEKHPYGEKRIAWITKFSNLLATEKQSLKTSPQ